MCPAEVIDIDSSSPSPQDRVGIKPGKRKSSDSQRTNFFFPLGVDVIGETAGAVKRHTPMVIAPGHHSSSDKARAGRAETPSQAGAKEGQPGGSLLSVHRRSRIHRTSGVKERKKHKSRHVRSDHSQPSQTPVIASSHRKDPALTHTGPRLGRTPIPDFNSRPSQATPDGSQSRMKPAMTPMADGDRGGRGSAVKVPTSHTAHMKATVDQVTHNGGTGTGETPVVRPLDTATHLDEPRVNETVTRPPREVIDKNAGHTIKMSEGGPNPTPAPAQTPAPAPTSAPVPAPQKAPVTPQLVRVVPPSQSATRIQPTRTPPQPSGGSIQVSKAPRRPTPKAATPKPVPPKSTVAPAPAKAKSVPQSDPFEGDECYTVEMVRKRRWNAKKKYFEYLIKWKGYAEADNSWEPEHNLHPDLLTAELAKKKYHSQPPEEKGKAANTTSAHRPARLAKSRRAWEAEERDAMQAILSQIRSVLAVRRSEAGRVEFAVLSQPGMQRFWIDADELMGLKNGPKLIATFLLGHIKLPGVEGRPRRAAR